MKIMWRDGPSGDFAVQRSKVERFKRATFQVIKRNYVDTRPLPRDGHNRVGFSGKTKNKLGLPKRKERP